MDAQESDFVLCSSKNLYLEARKIFMRKRIFAMLVALIMAISLLPVSALAGDVDPPAPPVVYGSYVNGVWVENSGSTGSITDAATGITVSKTAEPTDTPNEYTITLTVETGTTTNTVASEAATVLIIDVSGSMEFCAECGAQNYHDLSCPHHYHPLDEVEDSESRMAAAKAAASSFIDTYAGEAEGSGRYLAIVSFSTGASTVLGWTDVSTTEGKTSANNAVSGLSADGGTNLDAALLTATDLMGDDPVSSLKNKFTVALTDGAPTKSKNHGNGMSGSADINKETAASATALKNLCTLYTVCFGASDDLCWDGGWFGSDGPTVGAFLRDSIATTNCAYNADNTEQLNSTFNEITENITSSIDISGASVTDPMAGRVTCTLPSGVSGVSGDESGFEWTLSEGAEQNGGGYIYRLTYTITLDTTGYFDEDAYYPTNGDTYLTLADGTVIHFPVPAVKGVAPRYTVTYEPGDHGTFATQTSENLRYGDTTPAAPTVTSEAGWTFAGWEPRVADTVTGNATYVAQWDANEYTVTYKVDGEVYKTESYNYDADVAAAPTPTKEGYTFSGWDKQTPAKMPAENLVISGTFGINVYTISWDTDGDGKVDDTTEVAYGATPTHADGSKAADAQYTYTFTGWTPKIVAVTEDATYTAQFDRNAKPHNPPVAPKLNKADHYAYVVGYPDGTVQPQGAITRAEVATIFFRLLSDETRDLYWTKDNAYTDVKAGDWFNNAVSTLSNAGIINGYPDGTFRPNAPITRAEMAKVIAMFAELDKDSEGFKDIAGHWAEAYIKLAAGNGWIAGYPDGTFRPDQYITRAETMTMINRVLERVPSEEEHLLSHRVMLTFPDNQPGDWYYIAVQEATNSHTYERYATEKNGDEQWIKLIDNYDWTKLEF